MVTELVIECSYKPDHKDTMKVLRFVDIYSFINVTSYV